MKRGVLKIIAQATGFSSGYVYSVNIGRRKNKEVEQLIELWKKDIKAFREKIEEAKKATLVYKECKDLVNQANNN